VILAISGGGTRAAALGYGVLEELRRTEVTVNGAKRRLLDEVDVISAVSGGRFRDLLRASRREDRSTSSRRRCSRAVSRRAGDAHPHSDQLVPHALGNLRKSISSPRSTTRRCSIARLRRPEEAGGPFVIINGTDVTTGARFSFTQDQFDALCADLMQVPLGRAVATSTALPPLLTPITFENRGGTCGRKAPAWRPRSGRPQASRDSGARAAPRSRAPVLR